MHLPLLIFTLENPEWLIILAIVVILFGASRLGQIGAALGQSIREFRRAVRDDDQAPTPASSPLETPRSLPPNHVVPPLQPAGPQRPAAPSVQPPRLEYLPGRSSGTAAGNDAARPS